MASEEGTSRSMNDAILGRARYVDEVALETLVAGRTGNPDGG
jgi:hypothetical protein